MITPNFNDSNVLLEYYAMPRDEVSVELFAAYKKAVCGSFVKAVMEKFGKGVHNDKSDSKAGNM